MSFVAVNAKADVTGSKKGKITPAQNALINAFCLSNKTGILDIGGKCTATVQSVINSEATIKFNSGYIVICGRLIECEDGTTFTITVPSSGTEEGKIILRYDLNLTGNDEFKITTKSGGLKQEDLNEKPLTGVYEFELYSYTATSSSVTLERNITTIPTMNVALESLKNNIINDFAAENKPLYNYDTSKGTIEERLTNLGFKSASVTVAGALAANAIKRQGNYCICSIEKVVYVTTSTITNYFAENKAVINLPYTAKGKSYVTIWIKEDEQLGRFLVCSIADGGRSVIVNNSYYTGAVSFNKNMTIICNFGYEAKPL